MRIEYILFCVYKTYKLLKYKGFLIKIIIISVYKMNEIDNNSYLRLTEWRK